MPVEVGPDPDPVPVEVTELVTDALLEAEQAEGAAN